MFVLAAAFFAGAGALHFYRASKAYQHHQVFVPPPQPVAQTPPPPVQLPQKLSNISVFRHLSQNNHETWEFKLTLFKGDDWFDTGIPFTENDEARIWPVPPHLRIKLGDSIVYTRNYSYDTEEFYIRFWGENPRVVVLQANPDWEGTLRVKLDPENKEDSAVFHIQMTYADDSPDMATAEAKAKRTKTLRGIPE